MLNSNKDRIFLNIAIEISKFSHCISHQVGCIIVRDGRILSTGYNGTPAGYLNCDEYFDKNNFEREKHHSWSSIHEIHAELNAILYSTKTGGKSLNESVAYVTLQPCHDCVKNLIQAGIVEIIYGQSYDKMVNWGEIVRFAQENDVSIRKIQDAIS